MIKIWRRWGSRRSAALLYLLTVLDGGGAWARSPAAAAPATAPAAPVALTIMTFNIWLGGEQVSFPKVVEAIRLAGADVVGVQEPDGYLDALAQATGLPYTDHRRNIISRFPLYDSGVGERTETGPASYGQAALDADALFDWVMVRPGKVVAVANTHLTSDPFGPDLIRDGQSASQVMRAEETLRVPDARPFTRLAEVAARGAPVFLTGDFNSASGLDWTAGAAAALHRPYALDWPAMRLLLKAGLRDSYREMHPDPVAHPGYTWTAGQPSPFVRPQETPARIDFVLHAGPVKTLTSRIVGEAGGPDVDIAVSPYPSDHRAVVSTFQVAPVDAPAVVAAEPRRVLLGDTFMLRGWLPGSETFTLLATPRGAGPAQAVTGVVDEVRGYRTGVRLSTYGMAVGAYDAILVRPSDQAVMARTRFEVVAPDTRPAITAAARTPVGGTLGVRWSGAPGNRLDWIGVYRAGEPSVIANLVQVRTDARFDGALDIPLVVDGKPLPPGRYEARLMRDDAYVVLAAAPFSITPAVGGGASQR